MAHDETGRGSNKLIISLLAVLIIILIVLIFTITPFRNIVFPAKSAPEITLVLAEIPEWDEELEVYRFLVEARVTGYPEPQVQFNRNDDLSELLPNHTMILLAKNERFTVLASAVNSLGTSESSLELIANEAEFARLASNEAMVNAGSETTDRDSDDISLSEESSDESERDRLARVDPAPRITAVIYEDENITDLTGRGDLSPLGNIFIDFIEEGHEFTLLVDWGEASGRSVYFNETHGDIAGPPYVTDDRIIFRWNSPSNTEGDLEPLYATVSVEIRTGGGIYTDKITIGIVLEPVIAGEEPAGFITRTVSIPASPSLSGYIVEETEARTGTIMIGDDSANKQIKGYLTFDLSVLAGVDASRITRTALRITHVNKSGNPQSIFGYINYYVYEYGPELDLDDFTANGRRRINFTAGAIELFLRDLNYNFASLTLKEELQRAIDLGYNRLQVKMKIGAPTNNDGVQDILQFHPAVAFLDVTFAE